MANIYGKLDQSYVTLGSGVFYLGYSASYQAIAQSFVSGVSSTLRFLTFSANKNGTPDGVMTARVYTGSVFGSGTLVGTSVNTVPTSNVVTAVPIRFIFSDEALTQDASYWFEVTTTATISSANYLQIRYASVGTYTNGSCAAWNGSVWTAPAGASPDMSFEIWTGADGGFFNLDAPVESVADLIALKGSPLSYDDMIYAVNGAYVHVLDGENLICKKYIVGNTSAGVATAMQRWGGLKLQGGCNLNFKGDATAANSGFLSNPTTPDASSKGSYIEYDLSNGKDISINNSVMSKNVLYLYLFNMSYGYVITIRGWASIGVRALVRHKSVYLAVYAPLNCAVSNCDSGSLIADVHVTGLQHTFTLATSIVKTTLPLTIKNITFDFENAAGTATLYSNTGMVGGIGSNGNVSVSGFRTINNAGGNYVRAPLTLVHSTVDTYYDSVKASVADIRPTQIIPTTLTLTDPTTNGELRFTIGNISDYTDTDEIVIFDSVTNDQLACIRKAQYVRQGYGIIAGLTNGTQYTVYAMVTSDGDTYTEASSTVSGTPTAPVLPPAINVRQAITYGTNGSMTGVLALPEATKVKAGYSYGANGTEFTGNVTLPEEAKVILNSKYGANGTELIGSLNSVQLPVDNHCLLPNCSRGVA